MVFVFSIVTPGVSRTPLQVGCKPLLRRDYDGSAVSNLLRCCSLALHSGSAFPDQRIAATQPGKFNLCLRGLIFVLNNNRDAFSLGKLDAFKRDGNWERD